MSSPVWSRKIRTWSSWVIPVPGRARPFIYVEMSGCLRRRFLRSVAVEAGFIGHATKGPGYEPLFSKNGTVG